MKKFIYKKEFLRDFDRYKESEKELIVLAEKQIRLYCLNQTASYGLRIKKLFENNEGKTFEARVSDKIRLLYVEAKELAAFAFLGSHDEVRRYIRSFR